MWTESKAPEPVRFAIGLLGKLRRHTSAAAPREICGIVVAERRPLSLRIRDVKIFPNVAADPIANFEIESWRIDALVGSLSPPHVWGLFHSHTLTDARPSSADLEAFRRYGLIHVILSARGEIRIFLND